MNLSKIDVKTNVINIELAEYNSFINNSLAICINVV